MCIHLLSDSVLSAFRSLLRARLSVPFAWFRLLSPLSFAVTRLSVGAVRLLLRGPRGASTTARRVTAATPLARPRLEAARLHVWLTMPLSMPLSIYRYRFCYSYMYVCAMPLLASRMLAQLVAAFPLANTFYRLYKYTEISFYFSSQPLEKHFQKFQKIISNRNSVHFVYI